MRDGDVRGGAGRERWQAYGDYLRGQAAQAGMGSRDMAAALGKAEGGTMASSKSHIDRIYGAQARPKPPVEFTVAFLRITSIRAGLSQQEFGRRCEEAKALLRAAIATPPPVLVVAPDGGSPAELRLERDLARVERDLERALRAEERLRYSLRDAEILLSTLFQIADALREIIVGNGVRELRALRSADAEGLARVRAETREALAHRSTGQREADRVSARMRVLEGLWDRARTEIQRLSAHPDAAHLAVTRSGPGGAVQPLAPGELFTRPALDDIAAALAKAHQVNERGEQTLQDIDRAFAESGGFLEPDDELAVLVAQTRFPDPELRYPPIARIASGWRHSDAAREAVLRLTYDPDAGVRASVATVSVTAGRVIRGSTRCTANSSVIHP